MPLNTPIDVTTGPGEIGSSSQSFPGSVSGIPSFNTAPVGSLLNVTGGTGNIYAPFTIQIVQDPDGRVLIPALVGSLFWRINSNGIGVLNPTHPFLNLFSGKSELVAFANHLGSIWGIGIDPVTSDSNITEVISGISDVILVPAAVISPGDFLVSIESDGSYLWVNQATGGDIYRINTSAPGVIDGTLTLPAGPIPMSAMRIDQNASNYFPVGKRGFVLDPVNGTAYRFTLPPVGVPVVEIGPVGAAVGLRALAIGTGTFNGKLFSGKVQDLYRIDVDLATGPITNIITQWISINSLDYDPVNNKLWATAENFEGNIVVARIDPATLIIESLVLISEIILSGAPNVGYGASGFSAKIRFIDGSAWVCNQSVTAQFAGNVWRVNLTSGSFRTNDTNGSTVALGDTLTSAGHDFTAEGVVPGDILVVHDPDGRYYTVNTVGTTTLTVVVFDNLVFPVFPFPNTSAGLTYEIYQPLEKTLVAQPSPTKSLEFINPNWQTYSPVYDAVIGNGVWEGFYKITGNSMDINIGFIRGTTTTTNASTSITLPPGYYVDIQKIASSGGQGITQIVSGEALSLNGIIFNSLTVGFVLSVGFDLATLPVGDPSSFYFTVPILVP